MPASLTAALQRAASEPICSENTFGERGRGSKPMRDSTDCEAYDFRPSWMAALSLLTMSAGVHGASLEKERIELEQFNMVFQAAIAGVGGAIVPTFLARQDFASRALARLFDPLVNERRGDYLAYPDDRASHPAVVLFRDWPLKEFGRDN